MPKQIVLNILKRGKDGRQDVRMVDITHLNDFLTPNEIFSMEFKLNEIPSLRFHISLIDEGKE